MEHENEPPKYKSTDAQRRASRKYYYKKKAERENLINEKNKKLSSYDTSSDSVSMGDNENISLNNIHQDTNSDIGIDTNEQQDIYQFDELGDDKTYIIGDSDSNNPDNNEQPITVNVDGNQLKSVLSILVLGYVYFRIYNFPESNTVVQQLEQKEEYLRIIDRITNKLKLTIEKYSYLQKIYNNIEDFFFIIDIVLLTSVVENEITTTIKKDKTVKEVKKAEPEPEPEPELTNLFERL
jgi:hypothetical protein